MCGIHCLIRKASSTVKLDQDLSLLQNNQLSLIKRRGPDHFGQVEIRNLNDYHIIFSSSVLHMTGKELCPQPLVNERFIFMWNGEMYDGIPRNKPKSDTEAIFEALNSGTDALNFPSIAIAQTLEKIQGEYSFLLYDKFHDHLYFGRDFFGRRSLLLCQRPHSIEISSLVDDDDDFIPTTDSFSHKDTWKEIDCHKGIHRLSLSSMEIDFPFPERPKISISTLFPPLKCESEEELTVAEKTFQFLMKSVEKRLAELRESSIAILFSGGLDCSILAKMCDLLLREGVEIDLLNVAFEHPSSPREALFDVPDRRTGIESFLELQASNPKRKWNFVQIDISCREKEANKPHILRLMKPTGSIMDYSIATAIWHASRGVGILYPQGVPFHSCSRIIFSGMGADEQFGGYSRHKAKFDHGGFEQLVKEIQLDIDRISTRNLGRDDRCISDHGKEARFPFLDEEFVKHASQLPISHKCNLSLPRGQGEKRLLRVICEKFLGLRVASRFPKRAIQFGARTAHSKDSGLDAVKCE